MFAFTKLAVVVATLPFTVEVRRKELVEVETVRILVVPELMTDWRSVEVATPLTVEVSTVPEADKPFAVMILEVAVTPLIVVVKVLPAADWVKLLMKLITAEATPFTRDVKLLVVVEMVLELIIFAEEVETIPLTFEVHVKLLVVVATLKVLVVFDASN